MRIEAGYERISRDNKRRTQHESYENHAFAAWDKQHPLNPKPSKGLKFCGFRAFCGDP